LKIQTKHSLIDIKKIREGYEIKEKKRLKGGGTILDGKRGVMHGDKLELEKKLIVFRENAIVFTSSEII
jgi:hypothetical protein